jgi:hypothetical protein
MLPILMTVLVNDVTAFAAAVLVKLSGRVCSAQYGEVPPLA